MNYLDCVRYADDSRDGGDGECLRQRIDVSAMVDSAAICAAVSACADQSARVLVELYGSIERPLCLRSIVDCCRERFSYLEICDCTSLLGSNYVRVLAQENTVRGLLVKKLLHLCAESSDREQCVIYELALRELLLRFAEVDGDIS